VIGLNQLSLQTGAAVLDPKLLVSRIRFAVAGDALKLEFVAVRIS
jgi:hypothetical protein